MAHQLKKTFIAIALASACGGASSGGLDDLMGDMFMTTSTEPQPYSSNTRNGYYGGSASLRVPVRNYTLVNFDAPKISAGCSGISLSAGSFSIMNDEQFKQMIRQIGANAGMYFFKLALDQISPNIMRTLNGLEEFMSKFTLNNINTCKVGSSLATGLAGQMPTFFKDSAKEYQQDFLNDVATAKGAVSDIPEAWSKIWDDKVSSAGGVSAVPTTGNLVWRALKNKDAGRVIGTTSVAPDKDTMHEYLMSMVGTTIFPFEVTDSAGNVQSCGAAKCEPKIISHSSGLTLMSFLYGNKDNEVKYLSCGASAADREEMACLNPQPKPFPFEGTRKYVNRMLYGTPEGEEKQPGSLLYNLSNGEELTTEQLQFMSAMPADFIRVWLPNQKVRKASEMVAAAYKDYMAIEFTRLVGSAMIQALQVMADGKAGDKDQNPLSEDVRTQFNERRQELARLSDMSLQAFSRAATTIKEAETIRKHNPKLYYGDMGS